MPTAVYLDDICLYLSHVDCRAHLQHLWSARWRGLLHYQEFELGVLVVLDQREIELS